MNCSYCNKKLHKYLHVSWDDYKYCDHGCWQKHHKEEYKKHIEYYKKQESCNHIYGLEDCDYEGLNTIHSADIIEIDEEKIWMYFTYCPKCGKKL